MNARGRWFLKPVFFRTFNICAALLFLGIAFLHATTPTEQNSPLVLELKLDREVEPVLATYIDEGIADAASRHAALVLITMDTPGGLSESMKEIIQHILASPVPVVVYVSPTGARGASSGRQARSTTTTSGLCTW